MVRERTNEWKGWMTPPASASSGTAPEPVLGVVSSWLVFSDEGGIGCGISWGLLGRSVGFCPLLSYTDAVRFGHISPRALARPAHESRRLRPLICPW